MNSTVLCWLLLNTSSQSVGIAPGALTGSVEIAANAAPKLLEEPPSHPAVNASAIAQAHRNQKLVDASDLVRIEVPRSPFVVGQPTAIHVKFDVPGVTYMTVSERSHDPNGPVKPKGMDVAVSYGSDGLASFTYVPPQLGAIDLQIFGIIPKRGMFLKKFTINAVEPSLPVHELVLRSSGLPEGSSRVILMSLDSVAGNVIAPAVRYEGSDQLVAISAASVRYTVLSSSDQRVIQLNEATGALKAIGLGDALVTVSYGGVQSRVCVVVTDTRLHAELNHQDCHNLLQPGERLGSSR